MTLQETFTADTNSLGLAKAPADTRVVVAMSGGVDSSVVAAELAGQGYDVVGVTLQLYDHGAALAKKGACCAGIDIHDARRVAEEMGFPHYVLDYENIFRDAVIEEFADSYLAGATPVGLALARRAAAAGGTATGPVRSCSLHRIGGGPGTGNPGCRERGASHGSPLAQGPECRSGRVPCPLPDPPPFRGREVPAARRATSSERRMLDALPSPACPWS